VTAEVGREICQREGLKALVVGSIAPLGFHYAITLTAIDTLSGDTLAQVQTEAGGKEQVLHALSEAASGLRQKIPYRPPRPLGPRDRSRLVEAVED
jgi:hypothetical protein